MHCHGISHPAVGPQRTLQNHVQSSPGQALVGWDKTTRLTVHSVQNAGRKRRDYRRSLERQHKAIKLYLTTAGNACPLHFHARFESQDADFIPTAYLIPNVVIVQAQHGPVNPHPHYSPARRALGPARSSPRPAVRLPKLMPEYGGEELVPSPPPLPLPRPGSPLRPDPSPRPGARPGGTPGYCRWR